MIVAICDCKIKRTVNESMSKYEQCGSVKNIQCLDNNDYIRFYRSCLVSKNNIEECFANPCSMDKLNSDCPPTIA